MKRNEFVSALEKALAGLKSDEIQEIISDFQEHFATGLAGGKTEEEVARELGDPVALAGQYIEEFPKNEPPGTGTGRRIAQGSLALAGLVLFDIVIAIPVISSLFGVWVAFWAVNVAIFAGSLAGLTAPFWVNDLPSALSGAGYSCLGLSLLALSILWGIGMCYVTKWVCKGLLEFGRAHLRIINH
jgi:uncharacterized membrane protein